MELKLYYTPRTRADRVRWLLNELQLEYELVNVDLFGGEGSGQAYRDIHPLGQVPALEIDGRIMLESGAICHLLTDLHPRSGLAPALDSPARLEYEQWIFYAISTLEPWIWQKVLHGTLLPEKRRIASMVDFSSRAAIPILQVLEQAYQDQLWLLGDQFSTADILTISILFWCGHEIQGMPNLQRCLHQARERPALAFSKTQQ